MKKIWLLSCCIAFAFVYGPAVHSFAGSLGVQSFAGSRAGDSLIVKLNKQRFHPGDTLGFVCDVPGFLKDSIVGTLHVIIEDLRTNRRWRCRYPVINGEAAGDLVVGTGIDDGNYAINFVVQQRFFRVEGQVKDYSFRMNPLSYVVMVKNKPGFTDNASPGPDGSFRLKPTYFEDTAYFIFSPARRSQKDALWINIRTPLDSSFVPYVSVTKFISVAMPGDSVTPGNPHDYHFEYTRVTGPGVLPGLVVSGKSKKLVDRFNEEYSTGLFRSNVYMVFDGLESDLIAKSYSVYDFLRWRVPGFTAKANDSGGYDLRWRDRGSPYTWMNFLYSIPMIFTLIRPTSP